MNTVLRIKNLSTMLMWAVKRLDNVANMASAFDSVIDKSEVKAELSFMAVLMSEMRNQLADTRLTNGTTAPNEPITQPSLGLPHPGLYSRTSEPMAQPPSELPRPVPCSLPEDDDTPF